MSEKTAQTSGAINCNTKAVNCPKSRKFMVTFWEKKDFLWDETKMIYACMCDDQCSEEHENKWHGHYYVYYKNARSWKHLKKYFGNNCHIEIPYSNSGAINYIMGRGEHAKSKTNMIEMGTMPCDKGKHISAQKALNMTEDEINALENHKDIITIRKVRELLDTGIKLDNWGKNIKVTYIYGPSGSGKTTLAKKILQDEKYEYVHMIKYESTFYHGIGNGYGAAIYDDFRDSHMKPSEFINMIDYNKHYMNVKGGSIMNNFERIIITSVQDPIDLYSGINSDEPKKQWLRRLDIKEIK